MESTCGTAKQAASKLVDGDVSVVVDGVKLERRQAIEDRCNWTSEELLEQLLSRLRDKKYDEVHGLLIASTDDDIVDIYQKLFLAAIEQYDKDLFENDTSHPTLEILLVLIKSFGNARARISAILKCCKQINSWKTHLMLGNFLEEILPEIRDFDDDLIRGIRKIYIPSWFERFEKSVVLNHPNDEYNREYFTNLEIDYLNVNRIPKLADQSTDAFLSGIFMFLQIFALSMCEEYELLDQLLDKVLTCAYIPSDYLHAVIVKLDGIYNFADRPFPFHTLILVNSFKSKFRSVPRVFAPEYYFKLALPPLHHSLHISTSNMFNIGYVVLVLRNCLSSIGSESIGREQWTFFLGFLADFLTCCEECTLCTLRVVCMDTFKVFLSKFEPVAQVLIIRKLFTMISKGEIQKKNLHIINIHDDKSLKFEPQLLAWLIDLFRSKLNYEAFRRELGFFWGDLVSIRYSCLSDGLQYYLSVFILAQELALRKMNAELLLNIYESFLQPLQSQIADWTTLVEAQERHVSRESLEVSAAQLADNMKRLEMETRRQQDSQSLPLLQFQYSQTLNFVTTFLRTMRML